MPQVRHELWISNFNNTTGLLGGVSVDETAYYTGSITWYFEAVAISTASGTPTLELVDDAGNVDATLVFTASSSANQYLRSSSFTPTVSGAKIYQVRWAAAGSSARNMKVIILQDQATIAKTTSDEPVSELSSFITSFVGYADILRGMWKYTAADYVVDGTKNFRFIFLYAMTNSMATGSLKFEEDDGSGGGWTTFQEWTGLTATSITLLEAFKSPTDGRTYRVQVGSSSDMWNMEIFGAHIAFNGTNGIIGPTKWVAWNKDEDEYGNGYSQNDRSDWTTEPPAYHGSSFMNPTNLTRKLQYDIDGTPTDITGSTIAATSTQGVVISGLLTLPAGDFDWAQVDISGSGASRMPGIKYLVDLSAVGSIPPKPSLSQPMQSLLTR